MRKSLSMEFGGGQDDQKPLFALAVAFAVVTSASPAPAQAKERTKAELKALKKVMKGWSKALGVKCKLCHNPKDFKEWTAQREVGMAMSELFVDVLKPATDKQVNFCRLIAAKKRLVVPQEVLADFAKASVWIDQHK